MLILLTLSSFSTKAQTSTSCSAPENDQFDFWVGEWTLSWGDTGKGTNFVTRELGGCVVQENFNDPTGGLSGRSWSVYNTNKKVWQQTWVDNTGAYLMLEGGMKDGKMRLQMERTNKKGVKTISAMEFRNISKNSFDWEWMQSTDDGASWISLWLIHYTRKA